MLAKLLRPQVDSAALFLRGGLAAIFIVHGYIKLGQTGPFFEEVSLSTQNLLGWTELIGGLALAAGLLTRLAALGLAVTQVGAVLLVTGKYAFQGLSFGPKGADFTKVGPEFNLVLITMCLSLIVLGAGKVSLDHLLVTWWGNRKARPPRTAAVPPSVAEASVAAGQTASS